MPHFSYHVHEVEFVPSFKILTPTRAQSTFHTLRDAEQHAAFVAEGWTEDEPVIREVVSFMGLPCVSYRGDADYGTIILHY